MPFSRTLTLCLGLAASPALAIDTCMVGVWLADEADMAHVFGVQMDADVRHVSGTASLEITEFGVMTMLAEDITFAVKMPDFPPIEVSVNGYSQGAMNADDGRNYVANAPEYDLVGKALVLGQIMEIPVTSDAGMGWGNSRGIYGCTSDGMAFEATQLGSFPRKWRRAP